jgi:type VI secretion system protein ImpH
MLWQMDISERNISEIKSDVKVEVVAADLIEAGLDIDDIVISPLGLFERTFRKDIIKMEARQDKLGSKDLLFIDITREGIYNTLPEALFHSFEVNKKSNRSAAFIEEYKKHKAEEEVARNFFLAAEKELYRIRVLTELVERRSILGFADQFKAELFLNIWPELRDLSERYLPAMLLLLPVSHKIVGDLKLAQTLLSFVLNQNINIKFSNRARPIANNTGSNILGSRYLTTDLIIGNELPDYTPLIEICINEVKKGELVTLMPGGEARKVLDLACKYLFPIDLDINISIWLDIEHEKLILSGEGEDGKLGFTSRL